MIGALLVLFFKQVSQKIMDTLLGFAAGVMFTASFTSLIIPETHRKGHERFATFGTISGAIIMLYLDMVFK